MRKRPRLICLTTILLLCLTLSACKTVSYEGSELARPARGYVHWLEKQSMRNQARDLLGEVSQSERLWLRGTGASRGDVLLAAAPSWLTIGVDNAQAPLFSRLFGIIPDLPKLGIYGLYMGQIAETADLWLENANGKATSLDFSPQSGDEKTFQRLAHLAETTGLQLGSELPGIVTGIGPDFILQTRSAPVTKGIYAMLEVPGEFWSLLPSAKSEWDCQRVDQGTIKELAERGILPSGVSRDGFYWATKGGWAATGIVTGVDGKERRWLYRFSETPANPVLMWTDPFGQARQIMAAAIIRQTGLQGQTLTGLALEPLLGLEGEAEPGQEKENYSPGIEAINDLAAQIHRYGGWAIQTDPVPEEVLSAILKGECDFCSDDLFNLLTYIALYEEDCAELGALMEKRLLRGLDFKRLARGLNLDKALAWRLLKTPGRFTSFSSLSENQKTNSAANIFNDHADTVKLLMLGLPGLAFIDAPLPRSDSDIPIVCAMRKKNRLAEGKLVKVFRSGKNLLAFLSQLPNGNYWLTGINFSKKEATFTITLPFKSKKLTIPSKNIKNSELKGSKCKLTLDGMQCVNVIFSKE